MRGVMKAWCFTDPVESPLSCRVWFVKTAGFEAKGRCQCGPGSRAEYQCTSEDPPTASSLHGNGLWDVLGRTNGTEPLRRNVLQKQQNPLGLFLGFYGHHRTVRHRGSKRGGWNVYETMTSALRCGLRAGPHSSRMSWKVPAWAKDGRVSMEGNESRGGGNIQARATKTSPPSTGLPQDIPSSDDPPLGPGKEALPQNQVPPQGADGSDTERCGSPPDIDHLYQEASGRSATEDGKRRLWPRPSSCLPRLLSCLILLLISPNPPPLATSSIFILFSDFNIKNRCLCILVVSSSQRLSVSESVSSPHFAISHEGQEGKEKETPPPPPQLLSEHEHSPMKRHISR